MFSFVILLAFATEENAPVSVGVRGELRDWVLPGTELEVRALSDPRAPLVVRILNVHPHGSAFRYHLAYYALEAGEYDLRNALMRKDGSSTADLPPIPVTVISLLPKGHILPNPISQRIISGLGGYRWLLVLGSGLWLLGLGLILYQRGRSSSSLVATSPPRLTLAEQLRPLVERGIAGQLSRPEQAELERLIVTHWTHRLGLEALRPAELMPRLKADPTAGAAIAQLESWLHRPTQETSIDLPALLQPYNTYDQIFATDKEFDKEAREQEKKRQ